jgi:hypothetical protein|tara:strand:- start:656 stop:1543 length:888 start_codon:yes stop_codon:yes gene_type:complete
MSKIRLNKTYSSFSKDQVTNRANEVRRDTDTIKTPACTIYDVDYAIISYLRDVVQPTVTEDGNVIDVPIMYANGEKWSAVQKHGYMRDAAGKLMAPLISIKRNSLTERDQLKKLDVNLNPSGNAMVMHNAFSKQNRYDRFGVLTNAQRSKEYYITAVPEFIDVTYDLLLWTSYTDQLNSIIEQIMPTGGFAWGTTWKFNTQIDDYSFETMNNIGEDRLVRATMPLRTQATLLLENELRASTVQKSFSVKKVLFKSEYSSDEFPGETQHAPPGGYTSIRTESDLMSDLENTIKNRD